MISQAAYEVGPEFPARFTDADPANARYFTPSHAARHFMFDLPGIWRPAEIGGRGQWSICHSAPSVTRSGSSAIAARRTAMKKTMGG
jgi:hypothetical protein